MTVITKAAENKWNSLKVESELTSPCNRGLHFGGGNSFLSQMTAYNK